MTGSGSINNGMLTLLMSLFDRFKLQMLVVTLAAALAGTAFVYYHATQQRLVALAGEVATLRATAATQRAENERLRADAEQARVETDRLNRQLADIREAAAREQVEQTLRQLPPGAGVDAIERQANDYWQGLLRDLEEGSRGK